MSYYGHAPKLPEIEVGSDFVVVQSKHNTITARILRDETIDGTRVLTLDRLLDRHASAYVERLGGHDERKWSATGAFTTELRFAERVADEPEG